MTAPHLKALCVHLLTATGAVFAMLALLAAVQKDWSLMFLWLVVAFAVDGIDGPLARRYRVRDMAPIYDGVLLDLIIDYLTYVFIPAYALFGSGLLPGWTGWTATLVICFASALYFSDTRMKTKDYSFSCFPGCWNMVVLVFFAITPPWQAMLAIVALLTLAMFLPLRFVHPVRTERWRPLTLPLAAVWVVSAGWIAWDRFPETTHPAFWPLIVASLYLLTAGVLQQVSGSRAD